MTNSILIVDDDPHIREVIAFAMEGSDFTTHCAGDGAEALTTFEKVQPDLVILDVGMPELDGLEVCRRLRRSSEVPILFLSARDDEIDRIIGLEIGGDDYVSKPFSPRELVARVKVILKRVNQSRPLAKAVESLNHGDLNLDTGRRHAFAGASQLDLTGTEFDILRVLLQRPGIVFTRDQLLDLAWPDNIHVSDRTIDSHIRNLRAKLRETGMTDAIRTVHGVGFQLDHCFLVPATAS